MVKKIVMALLLLGFPTVVAADEQLPADGETSDPATEESMSPEEAGAILNDRKKVGALSNGELLKLVKTAEPDAILKAAKDHLAAHETHAFELWKQERIKGKWPDEPERLKVLYRHEPLALFVRWLDGGPDAGQEALYDEVESKDSFKARGTGWRGVMTVNLSLDSSLARARTNHPITSLSFYTFLDYLHADMALIPQDEWKDHIQSRRIVERDGQRLVEMVFVTPGPPEFYAGKATYQFEPGTWVPRFVEVHETDGTIRERFEFKSVQWEPVASDAFDPDNPDYRL